MFDSSNNTYVCIKRKCSDLTYYNLQKRSGTYKQSRLPTCLLRSITKRKRRHNVDSENIPILNNAKHRVLACEVRAKTKFGNEIMSHISLVKTWVMSDCGRTYMYTNFCMLFLGICSKEGEHEHCKVLRAFVWQTEVWETWCICVFLR